MDTSLIFDETAPHATAIRTVIHDAEVTAILRLNAETQVIDEVQSLGARVEDLEGMNAALSERLSSKDVTVGGLKAKVKELKDVLFVLAAGNKKESLRTSAMSEHLVRRHFSDT